MVEPQQAVAAEFRVGLGVVHADTAQQGQALRQRQLAQQVQVHAAKGRLSVQHAVAAGGRLEVELAQVKVTGFHGEVLVQLAADKQFIAGVALVLAETGDGFAVGGQAGAQARLVDGGARLAHARADVPGAVGPVRVDERVVLRLRRLRCQQGAGHDAQGAQCVCDSHGHVPVIW